MFIFVCDLIFINVKLKRDKLMIVLMLKYIYFLFCYLKNKRVYLDLFINNKYLCI